MTPTHRTHLFHRHRQYMVPRMDMKQLQKLNKPEKSIMSRMLHPREFHHLWLRLSQENQFCRRRISQYPESPDPPAATDGSGSPMEISALKSMDLDDMIQRLLDAAYAGKVTKTVSLKNAEIFAICSAAREVFFKPASSA